MGWLSKFFNPVPKEELKGVHLDLFSPHWEVSGKATFESVLNALNGFLPDDAILYFEGGSPSGEITDFMMKKAIPEQTHIQMGTIWPRPKVFHVPALAENLKGLAGMMDHHAEPELAIHFHVYCNGKVILQWYDAFSDPMFLSGELSEDKVRAFCDTLKWKYRRNVEQLNPADG